MAGLGYDKLLCRMRFAVLVIFCFFTPKLVAEYDQQHRAAWDKCLQIDESASQTGMWLNSDGYRASYNRSSCIQNLAIRFRDLTACADVKRKWAIFSSSWGTTSKNCRLLVQQGIVEDIADISALKAKYESGPITLKSLEIENNGNGRDYDLVPQFSETGVEGGYHLSFFFISEGKRHLLSESGFRLSTHNNIRMFERTDEIRQRFHEFQPGQRYRVEASMVFSIGTGSYRGIWSPDFIDDHFPVAQRTTILNGTYQF
jgi:hypothetical protein